jgi:hypothetical protein
MRFRAGPDGGGAISCSGVFGAWVYFRRQTDPFWSHVLVFFPGLFRPAGMVYEGFAVIHR